MGIVDFDVVDTSNLQRQILHSTGEVGRQKAESAKERIAAANPHVHVEAYQTRLTSENAMEILNGYDVVVDGTDNFPTRYLVNDACVLLKKPNVYGSIFRFEGQASVFYAAKGPCYRCLYSEPPPPGLVPSCAEAGVFGVLPGIIGSIQAAETIKILLGIGSSLIGRLLLFNSLAMQVREMVLRKNPDCPICGDHPTIKELIDYDEFCNAASAQPHPADTGEISVEELKHRLDAGDEIILLDVREPHEYQLVNLRGTLIPLSTLLSRVGELDSSKETVVHCHHGIRSAHVAKLLRKAGFKNVKNLAGGIDEWARKIDRTMVRY
jgi:adenylyltransferase/sulfurtransferase